MTTEATTYDTSTRGSSVDGSVSVGIEQAKHGQWRLIDLIDNMIAGKDVFFQWVRVVRDVMTIDVKTLGLDDTVEDCIKLFKRNNVRHVCVMDDPSEDDGDPEKPCFVGIVSERDVSRRISPYIGKAREEDTDAKALGERLVEIVTRKPASVTPETPISEMIATMIGSRVDMLPVLAGKDLVGIVTASDIMKLFVRLGTIQRVCANAGRKRRLAHLEVAALLPSIAQTVEDMMTEEPTCLAPGDCLRDVIEAMKEGEFRHVPILDQQGKLVGIVSDRDVLQHLSFPEGRRRSDDSRFRSRLFATDPKDPSLRLPVTDIMKRDIVHVSPNCTVYDAAKMLLDLRVSCLLVTEEENNLRGIVTITSMMAALLAAFKLARGLLD